MKDFEFDEKISKVFHDHISNSIPGYNEMLKECVLISEWFIEENSIVYDLGSSNGTLLKMLSDTYDFRKEVTYKGIEKQKEMFTSNYDKENIYFYNKDLRDYESFEEASVIIALFTIQFLSKAAAYELHQKIYDSLPKGGLFLFAEKFRSKNSYVSEIKKSSLLEFKLNNGFGAAEILEKDRKLRGSMFLNEKTESIDLLKKMGYSEIEELYLQNNFVLYACIK